MTMDEIGALLENAFANVHHYRAQKGTKAPWITWAGYSSSGLFAGDRRGEQIQYGMVHLFTLVENDPLKIQIESVLNENDISFDLVAEQFETDTGLIHFTWDCEAI